MDNVAANLDCKREAVYRRSMSFVSPAQFLGAGVGPAIASAGVHANDVRGALYIAALMLAVSLGVHGNRGRRAFAFNDSGAQNENAVVTVRMTHILILAELAEQFGSAPSPCPYQLAAR